MSRVFKEKSDYPGFWRNAQAIVLGIALVFLWACDKSAPPDPAATGAVQFTITEIATKPGEKGESTTWRATYEQGGKTARFQIKLTIAYPTEDSPFVFTRGAFVGEGASDSELLLRALAQALQAPNAPKSQDRTETLPFSAAILGNNLSRAGGPDMYAVSFTSEPAGTWIATKVFVAGGEGEFYLNLDPKGGIGEIAIKDPEYGAIVIRELAKVL